MISKKEVQHIAQLARLELSEEELEKMQKELASILGYVESLNELDASQVESTSQPIGLENVMREDITQPQRQEVFKGIKEQFPAREGDYLKVKEIL